MQLVLNIFTFAEYLKKFRNIKTFFVENLIIYLKFLIEILLPFNAENKLSEKNYFFLSCYGNNSPLFVDLATFLKRLPKYQDQQFSAVQQLAASDRSLPRDQKTIKNILTGHLNEILPQTKAQSQRFKSSFDVNYAALRNNPVVINQANAAFVV